VIISGHKTHNPTLAPRILAMQKGERLRIKNNELAGPSSLTKRSD
jgi:hypothetical protein